MIVLVVDILFALKAREVNGFFDGNNCWSCAVTERFKLHNLDVDREQYNI